MHAPAKISSVGAAEDMFIEIIDLTPSLEASQEGESAVGKEQWTIPGIYTADVCYCTMLTGMDTPISRVEAQGFATSACSAMPQIYFSGRHLKSYSPPQDSLWRKCGFAGLENGVVQVNAGKNWPGSVNLLKFAYKSETHDQ